MWYAKMLKYSLRLFVLLSAVLILFGCGGTSVTIKNTAVPISINPEECPSISISKIISSVPEATDIGSYHGGCFNIAYGTNTALVLSGLENRFKQEVEGELLDANYPIANTKNELFQTDNTVTDLLIGGIVVDCKYDTYDSVCGVYSEATVTVNWKIMDRIHDQIIYEKVTVGSAESSGISPVAIAYSVRGSFKDVLADPLFIEALMNVSE